MNYGDRFIKQWIVRTLYLLSLSLSHVFPQFTSVHLFRPTATVGGVNCIDQDNVVKFLSSSHMYLEDCEGTLTLRTAARTVAAALGEL